MKLLLLPWMLGFLLIWSLEGQAAIGSPNIEISINDSTEYVLLLKHREKKRQIVITPGTRIRYKLLGENDSRIGTLTGFAKDDKKLIIDGEAVPLNRIAKIKKRDTLGIVLLKFLGIFGIVSTSLAGLIWTGLLYDGFTDIGNLPSVLSGTIVLVLSIILIVLIGKGMSQTRMKSMHTTYEAKIVAITVEEFDAE